MSNYYLDDFLKLETYTVKVNIHHFTIEATKNPPQTNLDPVHTQTNTLTLRQSQSGKAMQVLGSHQGSNSWFHHLLVYDFTLSYLTSMNLFPHL